MLAFQEAAWAISNATSGGKPEQIKYLVQQGCIAPLSDLLEVHDAKIVTVALEGLENILKVTSVFSHFVSGGKLPFLGACERSLGIGLCRVDPLDFTCLRVKLGSRVDRRTLRWLHIRQRTSICAWAGVVLVLSKFFFV